MPLGHFEAVALPIQGQAILHPGKITRASSKFVSKALIAPRLDAAGGSQKGRQVAKLVLACPCKSPAKVLAV